MTHKTCMIAALVTAMAGTAQADAYQHVSTFLGSVPAAVFEGGEVAAFANLHALGITVQTEDTRGLPPARASLLAQTPVALAAYGMDDEDFRAAAGIGPYELDFLASYGAGVTIWGVERHGFATLQSHLPATGFTPVAGQTDRYAATSAGAPWVDAAGQVATLQTRYSQLYQAWDAQALNAALVAPSAYDHPAGRALADVYAMAPDFLVQALLFAPDHAQGSELAAMIGREDYLGAMLGDLETEAGSFAIIALAFPACPEIGATDPAFTARLIETPQGCLIELRLPDSDASPEINSAFDALHLAFETPAG